jgi:hypothetical protein
MVELLLVRWPKFGCSGGPSAEVSSANSLLDAGSGHAAQDTPSDNQNDLVKERTILS